MRETQPIEPIFTLIVVAILRFIYCIRYHAAAYSQDTPLDCKDDKPNNTVSPPHQKGKSTKNTKPGREVLSNQIRPETIKPNNTIMIRLVISKKN